MLRFHWILAPVLGLVVTGSAMGVTPDRVIAGSVANGWIQGGLAVTERVFDLGIQGQGFFVLKNGKDSLYTRQGAFFADGEAYIAHRTLGGRLLGYCDGHLGPINLARYARTGPAGDSATTAGVVKSFKVTLDGDLKAVYSNGVEKTLCRVALALFQNPRKLRREGAHALLPTDESGAAFIGRAREETRGAIYAASLEELDGHLYGLNFHDRAGDQQ